MLYSNGTHNPPRSRSLPCLQDHTLLDQHSCRKPWCQWHHCRVQSRPPRRWCRFSTRTTRTSPALAWPEQARLMLGSSTYLVQPLRVEWLIQSSNRLGTVLQVVVRLGKHHVQLILLGHPHQDVLDSAGTLTPRLVICLLHLSASWPHLEAALWILMKPNLLTGVHLSRPSPVSLLVVPPRTFSVQPWSCPTPPSLPGCGCGCSSLPERARKSKGPPSSTAAATLARSLRAHWLILKIISLLFNGFLGRVCHFSWHKFILQAGDLAYLLLLILSCWLSPAYVFLRAIDTIMLLHAVARRVIHPLPTPLASLQPLDGPLGRPFTLLLPSGRPLTPSLTDKVSQLQQIRPLLGTFKAWMGDWGSCYQSHFFSCLLKRVCLWK